MDSLFDNRYTTKGVGLDVEDHDWIVEGEAKQEPSLLKLSRATDAHALVVGLNNVPVGLLCHLSAKMLQFLLTFLYETLRVELDSLLLALCRFLRSWIRSESSLPSCFMRAASVMSFATR